MTPCSLLSCNRRFGGIYRLHLQGRTFCLAPAYLLVLAEIISSTLKMEAICSSKMSVATQQTTWCHIPEVILFMTTAVKTSNPACYCVFKMKDQGPNMRLHTDQLETYIFQATGSKGGFRFFLIQLTMLLVLRLYSIDDRMVNECGTVGGMRISRGNWSTWKKKTPQCHHKSHMTWHGTKATVVESQQITTWAMARPYRVITSFTCNSSTGLCHSIISSF
jgi:hypothetical protein